MDGVNEITERIIYQTDTHVVLGRSSRKSDGSLCGLDECLVREDDAALEDFRKRANEIIVKEWS